MNLQENTLFDLDLGGRGKHDILPIVLHIMWSMQMQSLKVLRQMVYKDMDLQKNDLILGVKLPSTLYIIWPMHLRSLNLLRPTVKVIWIVAQYLLHHVAYTPTMF